MWVSLEAASILSSPAAPALASQAEVSGLRDHAQQCTATWGGKSAKSELLGPRLAGRFGKHQPGRHSRRPFRP
ncbi:hypothetical protein LPJ72_006431, partial [Coemansia sp. Benny D160-2]